MNVIKEKLSLIENQLQHSSAGYFYGSTAFKRPCQADKHLKAMRPGFMSLQLACFPNRTPTSVGIVAGQFCEPTRQ